MNILQIALVVLVAALVIGKRMTGRPVDARRSVLMPGILAAESLVVLPRANAGGIPVMARS